MFEGFDHRWGQTAEVDYTVEHVDEPLADAAAIVWHADDVRYVATEAAGTEVTLAYPQYFYPWFYRDGAGLSMLGASVSCPPQLCEQALAATTTAFTATFAHDGTGGLELRAISP